VIPTGGTVFLVDDDPGVLKALTRLLRVSGHEVRAFASPQAFLSEHDPAAPGCLVLDVAMPLRSGLEVQQDLAASGVERAVVFISGQGDVPTSVRAMKAGAVDFLTKPFDDSQLLAAVQAAPYLRGNFASSIFGRKSRSFSTRVEEGTRDSPTCGLGINSRSNTTQLTPALAR